MSRQHRGKKNGNSKKKHRKIGDKKLHRLVRGVVAGKHKAENALVWHYVGPKRQVDD